jgi:hypothetical protein
MTRLLTLGLMVSAVALSACSSMGSGKTYPAPYAHERTAGSKTVADYEAPAFEKRMTK